MIIRTVHRIAASVAFAVIAAFWSATALSELFGTGATVALVKRSVLWGMPLLVLAMATTGATGMKLAAGRSGGLLGAKATRMKIIAANGLCILVPSAILLSRWADAGDFGLAFVVVQGLELAAGAANFTLMALNLRDGRRMARGQPRLGADT